MASGTPDIHEEDLRRDLEAMLKASRELGPEMDRALVDSFLGRRHRALQQNKRVVQRAPRPRPENLPGYGARVVWGLMRLVVGVASIALVVMLCGMMLWVLLPFLLLLSLVCVVGVMLMLAGGWSRWSGSGGYRSRMGWRQARHEWRTGRWRMHDDYGRDAGPVRPGEYI